MHNIENDHIADATGDLCKRIGQLEKNSTRHENLIGNTRTDLSEIRRSVVVLEEVVFKGTEEEYPAVSYTNLDELLTWMDAFYENRTLGQAIDLCEVYEQFKAANGITK